MSEPMRSGTRPKADERPTTFGVDPRLPTRRVWRSSPWPALLSGATLLLYLGSLTVLAAAAFYVAYSAQGPSDHALAIALALMAVLLVPMLALGWRDYCCKRRCELALEQGILRLNLPAGRSLTHRTRNVRGSVALAEIEALDTRRESYRALELRTYRLLKKDGTSHFLFEDRGSGSRPARVSHRPVVEEIAAEAGILVTELPPAVGRRGVLGGFFARAPGWPGLAPT